MNTEFIPYEQALALKELGFDEPCLKVGNPNGHTMWKWIEVDGEPPTVNINDVIQVHYDENWTQIPTFSQAFRWFREKYKLHSTITSISQESWQWHITRPIESLGKLYDEDFYTYEEAELACLIKLIEIVKQKQL